MFYGRQNYFRGKMFDALLMNRLNFGCSLELGLAFCGIGSNLLWYMKKENRLHRDSNLNISA